MASSPAQDKPTKLDLKVKIEGSEVEDAMIKSVHIETHLNRLPKVKIVYNDGDAGEQNFSLSAKANFAPGKALVIEAGYGSTSPIFQGVILKHRVKLRSSGVSELIIHGGDKSVKLTKARKSKFFEKKKDSAIISEVLGGNAGEVKSTTEEHPLVIQNNATDWDFVMSRAEINGLVAHVDNGKVNMVKPIGESSNVKVTYGLDLFDFDLEVDSSHQIESVTCKAWDYKGLAMIEAASSEPTVNSQGDIDGKTLAGALGVSPYNLVTTAPATNGTLKAWADGELTKIRLGRITGHLTFRGNSGPKPNTTIEIDGISPRLNGTGFVSGVEHHIKDGVWKTKAILGISPVSFVEEFTATTVPPASGMLPGIHGLQNGKVKSLEADPDGQFRIQVDIPAIDTAGSGAWARMATFYASAEHGAFFIPEVGDEVILGFLNGDPSFPVILGMMYNGSPNKAPETWDAENKIKSLTTKEGMKITFDEDKKIITVETPGENKITLDDDAGKIELADSNSNKVTLDDKGITLTSGKDIILNAASGSGKVTITGDGGISLTSKQDIKIDTKMGIKNTCKLKFEADGTAGVSLSSTAMAEISGSAMVKIAGGLVKIN